MSLIEPDGEEVEPKWVGEVIHFWFEELAETDWFVKNDILDAQIRDRFLALHERLAVQTGDPGVNTPRSLVARVIVLDQFSRNMFRGGPRAFAADPIALRLSRTAIVQGLDTVMTKQERYFLYLPFEHSEKIDDQVISLNLIQALGDARWTQYARAHKDIIDRFGRFPHRNAILNRVSTPDEIAFLQQPMSSF
jgi:uncharacterized protein (DUF924 family)